MPVAVYALTIGAFGIGTTEFVIMGLLLQVSADLGVSVPAAGLLISGYALGVFFGAPLLTLATRQLPRKNVLLWLMIIFILGNAACALAPSYTLLMAGRIVTSLAHGTFFGVGSIVATKLVGPNRQASAIAIMFTGLTLATLLGVPFGAWLGLEFGWRMTFWAVALIGVAALIVLALLVPNVREPAPDTSIGEELSVLLRPQVQLGFGMTVLGYAGVFTVYTYIQPMLTELAGFSVEAVSPILLAFGAGLAVGNVAGGRLADRSIVLAVLGTLSVLTVVLTLVSVAMHHQIVAVLFVGLLGGAAFATVPPLQMRILDKARGAGQNLASSLNIAAFNLGNALGAWLGGVTIDHGPGLNAVPFVAALVTATGLAIALISVRLDRRQAAVSTPLCGA